MERLIISWFSASHFPAGDNMGFDDERGRLFLKYWTKELNEPPCCNVRKCLIFKKFDNGARLMTVTTSAFIDYWVSERHAMIIQ